MKLAVLKFNQIRNGFKLDMGLEKKMLEEEIQEFFDANTTAERLDALVDTLYVYEGTKMKCAYNGFTLAKDFNDWIEDSITIMQQVLIEELGFGIFSSALDKAQKIVADINALKLNELDENGKVKKQKSLPNATEQIAKMIKELRHD